MGILQALGKGKGLGEQTIMAIFDKITSSFAIQGFVGVIAILLYIFIFCVILGIIVYIVLMNLRYNKRIVIFENLAGKGYVPVGKDRAMLYKIGDSGEEILKLRRRKSFKSSYGKKMGKNTYWFAIGGDGYWYNVTLEDLDTKKLEMGVNPVDRDMRYMHVAIRRNIQQRFDKPGFWEKYGGLIAYTILILITGIMMWLLFDKYITITNQLNAGIQTGKEVMDAASDVLAAVDNINTQRASGIVPAPAVAWLPLLSIWV